jgi:hypothetical protein
MFHYSALMVCVCAVTTVIFSIGVACQTPPRLALCACMLLSCEANKEDEVKKVR